MGGGLSSLRKRPSAVLLTEGAARAQVAGAGLSFRSPRSGAEGEALSRWRWALGPRVGARPAPRHAREDGEEPLRESTARPAAMELSRPRGRRVLVPGLGVTVLRAVR